MLTEKFQPSDQWILTLFPTLFIYPWVGISRSASIANDRFYFSAPYSSEQALRMTLASFETAYLSKSLSRLFDQINLAFSSGSFNPPTLEEVDSIVKTISRYCKHFAGLYLCCKSEL